MGKPRRKPHDTSEARLQVRLTREELDHYQTQASARNETLSDAVRAYFDRRYGRPELPVES